jgi:hypothetical protein
MGVGLVYLYVMAWVLGGVVLGGRLLLTHREPGALTLAGTPLAAHASARRAHASSLVAIALVGFGLSGLLAEGFGYVTTPWTLLVALGFAALLASAGHVVTRSRAAAAPVDLVH